MKLFEFPLFDKEFDKKVFSLKECEDYLKLSYPQIFRYIKSGKLKSYKKGQKRFVKGRWIREFWEKKLA